jgi:hypothetical protein
MTDQPTSHGARDHRLGQPLEDLFVPETVSHSHSESELAEILLGHLAPSYSNLPEGGRGCKDVLF